MLDRLFGVVGIGAAFQDQTFINGSDPEVMNVMRKVAVPSERRRPTQRVSLRRKQ